MRLRQTTQLQFEAVREGLQLSLALAELPNTDEVALFMFELYNPKGLSSGTLKDLRVKDVHMGLTAFEALNKAMATMRAYEDEGLDEALRVWCRGKVAGLEVVQ